MKEIIEWDFPLVRPYCGVAMGNGNMGVLIWGEERIHITVNRADFWDRRGGAQPLEGVTTYERARKLHDPDDNFSLAAVFPPMPRQLGIANPSRLPAGRFDLELCADVKPLRAALHPRTGEVVVWLQDGGMATERCLRFVLSYDQPLLRVYDSAGDITGVRGRPSWEWCADWLKGLKFNPPVEVREPDLTGWVQSCPADPALAGLCGRVSDGSLLVLVTGRTADDALATGRDLLNRAGTGNGEAMRVATAAWWRNYWRRIPRLRLPDKSLTDYYDYATYLFGCATNPVGGIAAGLQGSWIDETQPVPWGGDYHFNCNVQLMYTAALHLNQPEHMMPLFDMLDSWQPVLRRNARIVCGIDDGLLLGMCTDDKGCILYNGAGVLLDHAVAGWLAQLYWLYYRHTGDIEFLRLRAWPFMRGVMRVYETMLEEYQGRLSLPVSISAEYGNLLRQQGKSNCGRDPSWQLACIHMLADALLKAAPALKEPPSPAWHDIKKRLPAYTLVGEQGEDRIGIWDGLDLEISHRHHSHMAGIYPFDGFDDQSAKHREIIARTIDRWVRKGMGEWVSFSLPWAAMLLTRLDQRDSAELMLSLWRRLYLNEGGMGVYGARTEGFHVNRPPACPGGPEIMQLDGMFAGIAALLEMLVHVRGDVIHIGAGVPRKWADLRFDNLPVPGGFLISGCWGKARMAWIKIKSLQGGPMKIKVAGENHIMLQRADHCRLRLTCPACIACGRGETVELFAGESNEKRNEKCL